MSRVGAGLRLAVSLLTVVPAGRVQVDSATAGAAMLSAPLVGLALAVPTGAVLALGTAAASPLVGAVLATALLALLTRGLHLDGLADTADGLGSGRPADQALEVMRRGDVGPFGVVTLVFALLAQVAALASLAETRGAAAAVAALTAALVVSRAALPLACRAGTPAARPGGLGALVVGAVPRALALGVVLGSVVVAGQLGALAAGVDGPTVDDSSGQASAVLRAVDPGEQASTAGLRLAGAALAGAAAAELVVRRARARLGGVTGDVLGATVEVTATVVIVVASLA